MKSKMHPLDRFARRVEYTGWYQKVLGRMRVSIQPLYAWGFILLLTSCSNLIAPIPYLTTNREYIYLDSRNPSDLSLANSDPERYRIQSQIDLTKVPDIVP